MPATRRRGTSTESAGHLVGLLLQRHLHAVEPDVAEAVARSCHVAAEDVDIEVTRFVQVPNGDGEVENGRVGAGGQFRSGSDRDGSGPSRRKGAQGDMASGSRRNPGADTAAAHTGRERTIAGGVESDPGRIVQTQAPCTKTGARPSTEVRNPEAYTGSTLVPVTTTSPTSHCLSAAHRRRLLGSAGGEVGAVEAEIPEDAAAPSPARPRPPVRPAASAS